MSVSTAKCPKAIMFSLAIAAATVIGGCNSMPPHENNAVAKKDGEIAVPNDYRSWANFVPTVDKDAAGQVRELYVNEKGLETKRGESFPFGTVHVMEIYNAKKDGMDNLQRDSTGKLVKGDLAKIFVMAKGEGWGRALDPGTIKNGDWVYGAYEADGKTAAMSDFTKCRSCHEPLASDDYIAGYNDHFDNR